MEEYIQSQIEALELRVAELEVEGGSMAQIEDIERDLDDLYTQLGQAQRAEISSIINSNMAWR